MTRIAALFAVAFAATATAATSADAQASAGFSARVSGDAVSLRAAAGVPHWDAPAVHQLAQDDAASLRNRAVASAARYCRGQGFANAVVVEASSAVAFPQPWIATPDGATVGPAQAELLVRAVCR